MKASSDHNNMTLQPAPIGCCAVAAPADLEAGYEFFASHNGKIFRVTVPAGGVKMGDHILVSIPETSDDCVPFATTITFATTVPCVQSSADKAVPAFSAVADEEDVTSNPMVADSSAAVPIGRWREGFFDCFEHGFSEPTCCLAFWCNGMALAQVMTRLKLNAGGEPNALYVRTFAGLSAFWIVYLVYWMIFAYAILTIPWSCISHRCMYGISGIAFQFVYGIVIALIYFIYLGTVTRMRMRTAFQIPGSRMGDFCAFFWFPCCTVTQMARHTHDHHTFQEWSQDRSS